MDIFDYPDGATPLDPDELAALKFKHVTTRGQLDHLEQANIQNGLRWLERRRNKTDILHEGFVRDLHERLFGEVWTWAGTFRTTEKNIGIDPRQISVQLRDLLADASYWIEHQTYEPIEIATRLHHRLVYIHLFPNGNGRHARIMADVVLTELLKANPIDWGMQDLQTANEHRRNYIQALQQADQGNYEPLLKFVGVGAGTSQ
jgi:Fic-DOC domain mobile mystery protein B